MKGTFTLPDGQKVRVASTRRYVVVGNRWQDGRFRVEVRSDSEGTILARWRAMSRQYRSGHAFYVIDTVEGKVIR